jgi:hypothetical protein
LEATGAALANISRPFKPEDVVCRYASLEGNIWVVHRDGYAYTLESRPSGNVRLLSFLSNDPRIQDAIAGLQARLNPMSGSDPASLLRMSSKTHGMESLEALIPQRTNEWLVSAKKAWHVAQSLGLPSASGGVTPGTQLGIVLHRTAGPRAVVPEAQANSKHAAGSVLDFNLRQEHGSGGYVGLFSTSTNLSSIDLVILVYRGRVEAILQRLDALAARPLPASTNSAP